MVSRQVVSTPSVALNVLVPLSWLATLGSASAEAQGLRVNAPLLRDSRSQGEDVEEYIVAPGSLRVAFLADPETEGRLELFAAPLAEADARVRLSSAGASCAGPLGIAAGRVVYTERQPSATPIELFSVVLDGSAAPVRLSPDLPGLEIRAYELSASARRAVFQVSLPGMRATTPTFELWSAPLDGSSPAVRLDLPIVAGGNVGGFRLSSDGRFALFTAARVTVDMIELWAAPVDGSRAAVRLSGTIVPGGGVREHFAASGARAIFTADAAAVDVIELWSAPLDGSTPPVRLNGPLVAGGDVGSGAWPVPFRLGADGATVVYVADQETDGVFGLFGVPAAGGAVIALGGGRPLDGASDFEITPDDTRVVYGASDHVLYGAPLDGGPVASLSGHGWRPPLFAFARTTDGTRVVYMGFESMGGLWSVPADGSRAPQRLDGTSAPGEVRSFCVAGPRVLYTADELRDEQYELFSVPATGEAPRVRLSAPLPEFGDVLDFAGTPGGLRALYRADTDLDDTFALWSVPASGAGTPVELSMPFDDPGPAVEDVREFAWSDCGARLLYGSLERLLPGWSPLGVYSASLDALDAEGRFPVVHVGTGHDIVARPDGTRCAFRHMPFCEVWPCEVALRVAPTDGSAAAVEISNTHGWLREVRFGPGDANVAYVRDGLWEWGWPPTLHLAPADGSAPSALLSTGPGLFEFSADGRYFVYTDYVSERTRLYSVPADLSGPPVALEPPFFDPLQSVRALRLTGDGRAVFLADPLAVGAYELWIAPLDGNTPAVRLGPREAFAIFEPDFRITSDDAYAVYVVHRELWSVPLDPARGNVPVRLSVKSAPGSGVVAPLDGRSQFELAPDGSRVVYLDGRDASAVRALYSVPIDGTKPPVRLHGALGYDRGVEPSGFEISADSRWVVFAADLVGDGVRALYRAPLGGGLAPFELSGPFVSGGELRLNPPGGIRAAFEISADSRSVVYLADQDEDERVELYSARLDGSRPPRRLNRRLPLGGDVESFALQPGGAWVAYLADQERNDDVELFVSALGVDHWFPSDPPRPLR